MALDDAWADIRNEVLELDEALNGNPARNELWERTLPTVRSRLGSVLLGLSNSTYGPTQTHREQLDYAEEEFADIRERIIELINETVPDFEDELQRAGAPWVPGSRLPE